MDKIKWLSVSLYLVGCLILIAGMVVIVQFSNTPEYAFAVAVPFLILVLAYSNLLGSKMGL